MNPRITIAVSGCLLGLPVRYDGANKWHPAVTDRICTEFHCLSVCPEVGIGLGVPRAPIQIVDTAGEVQVNVVGKNTSENTPYDDKSENQTEYSSARLDIKRALGEYADHIAHTYPEICGFIFKARSPSCGVNSTPIVNPTGKLLRNGAGIFSERWQILHQAMPIIEEDLLINETAVEDFITQVKIYAAGSILS